MLKNTKVCCAIMGAATALGLLVLPGVASAEPLAEIIDFTYGGNGCPDRSVGKAFDPVSNTMTLNFDKFMTTLPPGVSTACTVTFVVKVPRGYQVSLNKVEYLGYIDTDPTVRGEMRRRYFYGDNPPMSFVKDFAPGSTGDYYIADTFPGWSLCKETVTVVTTARVDLRGVPTGIARNELVVDAEQFNTKVVYYFGFLPC